MFLCNGNCCFCPNPCRRSIITKIMSEKHTDKSDVSVEKLQKTTLPEVISPAEDFEVKHKFGKLIARKTK